MRFAWLRRRWQHIAGLFTVLEGNAGVIVLTEAVAAPPHYWFTTYFSLYMLALGVSKLQVGWLASALLLMQFVGTLFGGYAADRWGRKRVLVVGDIICWGIPMLLFAIAQNPWYFLAGQLINGLVYIVLPAFQCLFVEDVPVERRTAVFGVMQLLYSAGSLLTPVSGVIVARMGIVAAGRLLAILDLIALVGAAVVRQFTLRETTIGAEKMAAFAGQRPRALVREYIEGLRAMARSRPLLIILSVRLLDGFAVTMWTTYAAIFLTDAHSLALPESAVAAFPFVSAAVSIAMILSAAGRLRVERTFSNLVLGRLLWLAAALCFVLSPPKVLWFAVAWAALNAVGVALFSPAIQSHWANLVGDRERAQVFSAGGALLALGALPAGPLAGALYTLSPTAPFLAAIAVQGIGLGLILWAREHPALIVTTGETV